MIRWRNDDTLKKRIIRWRKDDTFEKNTHRREKDAPRKRLRIVGRKTRQRKADMPEK